MKFIYVVEDTKENKVAFTEEEKARSFYINLLRKTIKEIIDSDKSWFVEDWEIRDGYERLEKFISYFSNAHFYSDREDCWLFGFDSDDNSTYCRIYSIPIAD